MATCISRQEVQVLTLAETTSTRIVEVTIETEMVGAAMATMATIIIAQGVTPPTTTAVVPTLGAVQ